MWVVGTSGDVFSWNGTGWDTERVGNDLAIDVTADDEPVVVDTQNRIFRRQAGVWVQLNGLAKDVSVGADGTIWIVGTSNQVFRFNGTGFVLVHDVSATRVAGDPDGGVGFIASGSRIFIH